MITTARGFTLIELSIVLVIIGLLVGGVLVGRDLIHAAQIRKTVSQIEAVDTAINTFRAKYNCLPGDCAHATDFFTGTVNGNGDGVLTDDGFVVPESINIWGHLGSAGLLSGRYGAFADENAFIAAHTVPGSILSPYVPIGKFIDIEHNLVSTFGVSAGTYFYPAKFTGHRVMTSPYTLFDTCIFDSSVTTGCVFMKPIDAYAIDSKMDDGKPNTGRALSFQPTNPASPGCGSDPNVYDTSITLDSCFFYIKSSGMPD